MYSVKFKFVAQGLSAHHKQMLIPKQKSDRASGFDLASSHSEDLTLLPGRRVLVSTGIAISLPVGLEGQVRSRSGLALNHGVVVHNSPGTIDADYRGEIKVILANMGDAPFVITFGMRIAQLVFVPVALAHMVETGKLDDSLRGEAGFGSTGL